MMSASFKRALNWALMYADLLKPSDERYRGGVAIVLSDGTFMSFAVAFSLYWTDPDGKKWLCIFPEHHMVQVMPEHLVEDVRQYVQQSSPDQIYAQRA